MAFVVASSPIAHFLTGARRDDILTLRWEFDDFECGLLHLPDGVLMPIRSDKPPDEAAIQQQNGPSAAYHSANGSGILQVALISDADAGLVILPL